MRKSLRIIVSTLLLAALLCNLCSCSMFLSPIFLFNPNGRFFKSWKPELSPPLAIVCDCNSICINEETVSLLDFVGDHSIYLTHPICSQNDTVYFLYDDYKSENEAFK